MLEDFTKQGEAGFEQIRARFSKQRVQPRMPERLNTKPLEEIWKERRKNLSRQGTGLKPSAQDLVTEWIQG